ncbi:MAG: nitrate/nitrite transporter NrtS, partial [Thermoanaerobaculia bacterium]|nr:nitrate/nitrite transporter NrtS [Thermoanaerobaculia bacterium]
MADWLRLALSPSIVRRGIKYAVGVGAILVAINHGDALMARQVEPARWLRIVLTVMVPYLV